MKCEFKRSEEMIDMTANAMSMGIYEILRDESLAFDLRVYAAIATIEEYWHLNDYEPQWYWTMAEEAEEV